MAGRAFRMRGSIKRGSILARQGLIRGGKLDGCRYTFERFLCERRGTANYLRLALTVNEPDWPFPRSVVLKPLDFYHLVPVSGERSPSIDAAPLIRAAVDETNRGRP